jgi:hypothetical protein
MLLLGYPELGLIVPEAWFSSEGPSGTFEGNQSTLSVVSPYLVSPLIDMFSECKIVVLSHCNIILNVIQDS